MDGAVLVFDVRTAPADQHGDDFFQDVTNKAPKVEGVCDKCGGELYQRNDDKVETVSNRLDVYAAQTAPLIEYYQSKGIMSSIDGSKSMEDVLADIRTALGSK